jgi:hypothetical protein
MRKQDIIKALGVMEVLKLKVHSFGSEVGTVAVNEEKKQFRFVQTHSKKAPVLMPRARRHFISLGYSEDKPFRTTQGDFHYKRFVKKSEALRDKVYHYKEKWIEEDPISILRRL